MKTQFKVCHVTTVHPADDIRIFHKECCSLARTGRYEVVLLATNCKTQTLHDVSIKGVECICRSRWERSLKCPWLLYQEAIRIDADVYHFHDPDFLPYARRLQQMGKFVIYDVHEDVPRDILSKFWLPRASRKVLATLTEYYENQAVKKFTSIVAATPLIKERFDSLNMSTLAVMNYPIFEEFNPVPWKERQYEVCYTGVITPSSGIDALIESVSLSRASGVRLNLAGRYSPESYRITLSRKKGWKNVNECGNLGRKDVVNVIRKSKAGIALNIEARSTAALSTKMFEYMAAGVPVIVSDIPTWKDIVDKHRCGICVNPHDSAAIADAIHYLASNEEISVQMGMNGRRAVERCFSWEMEFAKLLQLYNSIHSRNPGLFSKRIPSQIEGSPVASTFRSR